MHFTGKILVVIQLVLSIAFMAFAGVVYTAHINWRTVALTEKANVTKKAGENNDLQTQMDAMRTEFAAKMKEANEKVGELEATKKGLDADVKRFRDQVSDLQVAGKTSSEQALIAGQESSARKSEADNQREINHGLTSKRDLESNERIKLEDEKRGLEVALDSAVKKNTDLIRRLAILQRALEAAGLTSDVNELATKDSPPPVVNGKIDDVKAPRQKGGTELVEITLGSDDGLKRGHEMFIWRPAAAGQPKAKYLGKIVIRDTTPDRAVGEVIETSRNGVIQKGDNVTTKL